MEAEDSFKKRTQLMRSQSLVKRRRSTEASDRRDSANKTTENPAPQLTVHELQAMKETFVKFDADGSGTIDQSELQNIFSSLGVNMSNDDVTKLINLVSPNATELEFEELVKVLTLYKEAAQYKMIDATLDMDEVQDHVEGEIRLPWDGFAFDALPITLWHLFMLLIAAYQWVVPLYADTIHDDTEFRQFILSNAAPYALVMILVLIDMAVSARTIHTESDTHVWSTKYFSTYFWVDVVTVLPLELILAGIDSVDPLSIRIVTHLKLLRLPATRYYFRRSGRTSTNRWRIFVDEYVVPTVGSIIGLLCFTHLLAIIWFALSENTHTYLEALFFAAYSISGVGYGTVVVPETTTERIVACVFCILAEAVIAFVVGGIVNVISQSDTATLSRHKVIQAARVMRMSGAGLAAHHDVLAFEHHIATSSLEEVFGDLVLNLPQALQHNITLFARVNLLAHKSMFKTAHKSTQMALAQVLSSCIMKPGEALFICGDIVEDMLFVAHGLVEVRDNEGNIVRVVYSGENFNQKAIIMGYEEKKETARCLTHCDIHVLSKASYLAVLERFPVFKDEMERAKQREIESISGANTLTSVATIESLEVPNLVVEGHNPLGLSQGATADADAPRFKVKPRRKSGLEDRVAALSADLDFGRLEEEEAPIYPPPNVFQKRRASIIAEEEDLGNMTEDDALEKCLDELDRIEHTITLMKTRNFRVTTGSLQSMITGPRDDSNAGSALDLSTQIKIAQAAFEPDSPREIGECADGRNEAYPPS